MKEEKKKKSYGKNIIIFLLLVIIVGLVVVILNEKKIINIEKYLPLEKKEEVKKDHNKNKDSFEELNLENENVKTLFDSAHNKISIGVDKYVFNNEKLTIDDMDVNYKFALASNFLENVGVHELKNEEVKNAYERVFGPNTYNIVDKFNLGCGDYIYDPSTRSYKNGADGCGGTSGFFDVEKMISAKKYNDRIEITSAVLYYSAEDSAIFRDYNRTNKIKDYKSEGMSVASTLDSYVLENKQYLEQYTYVYKLNDDGFYYYNGVTRTQK